MDDRFGLNFFGVDLIIGKLLYLLSNLCYVCIDK